MIKKITFLFLLGSALGFGQVDFTEHAVENNFDYAAYSWAGDFDGDGDNDIVATSLFGDQVVWFENDGSQNFTKHIIASNFDGAYWLIVGDFDSDNDLDVWAWAFTSGEKAWFENDGNQTFTKHTTIGSPVVTGFYVMDYNGDGKQNFVHYDDTQLIWYELDSQHNYVGHTVSIVTDSWELFAGDLDEDSDVDWIVQDTITNEKYVIINDLSGVNQKSQSTINLVTDGFPHFSHSEDLDKDGDLDLFAYSVEFSKLYWYENDGSLNYTRHVVDANIAYPFDIRTVDYNKDGYLDISATAYLDDQLFVYLNDGNQNFTKQAIVSNFDGILFHSLADLDNDNDVDVVVSASIADKVIWLENNYTPPVDVALGKCYNEFENLNWISNCSFDLQGRLTSSGVSYFNSLGKATQSQTTDIKTGRIWATQTLYDYQGRAAFQSLSAPVDSIYYGYKNFVAKTDGTALTTADIESITENNTNLPGISNQPNTLGWYYSENNSREPYQDITAYPYSKSVYSNLNTGEVLKTLGGNKVSVNGQEKWLNGYSFTMPAAQELFYAFGKDYFPQREGFNISGTPYTGEEFCTIRPFGALDNSNDFKVRVTTTDVATIEIGSYYEFLTLSNNLNGIYKVVDKIDLTTYFADCSQFTNQNDIDICTNINLFKQQLLDQNYPVTGQIQSVLTGIPYYVKANKTVSRDVHGVETVVFTDADGNTLAAARSGNEDGNAPAYEVVSTIGEQGFVDIHIPVGTDGIVQFEGKPGMEFKIYDLISEEDITAPNNSTVGDNITLNPGMYRIEEVIDTEHVESYVTINNNGSIVLLNPSMGAAVRYKVNYYDYSLNYYDKANRLVKSVQPLGFDHTMSLTQMPNHSFTTTFNYNTLGQLQESTSPDEGTAQFKYRKDGQIRFSQNSKQLAASPQEFSYTNYDTLGRPVESGVLVNNGFATADPDNPNLPGVTRKEQHFTVYDSPDITGLQAALTAEGIPTTSYPTQQFVAGNVAKTYTQNPSTTTTWYSYDVYGRVQWLVQKIDGLGTKTIDYEYDQTTGEVTKVCYQKQVPAEMFIHKYTYNIAGQLTAVSTSTDNVNFTNQAKYYYYETGALKRTELADNLQGIDYTYNLAGRLKAINSPNIGAIDSSVFQDPGNDGNNGFAQDVFGMTLDYYTNDYQRTNTPSTMASVAGGIDQFNGNIKAAAWKTNTPTVANAAIYYYNYNKNNWLKSAGFSSYDQQAATAPVVNTVAETITTNKTVVATESIVLLPGFQTSPTIAFEAKITPPVISTPDPASDYDVTNLTYDANGNIQSLDRNKQTENGSNAMDKLAYTYKPQKNQLDHVTDAVTSPTNTDDIKSQTAGNYTYNQIGQLVHNTEENIDYVYNASGLVTEVQKNNQPLVKFYYNDKGHRVRKESFTNGTLTHTEYYIRDVAGNTLAIYRNGILKELPIYGASRLGIHYKESNTDAYQLTDHLGNIRAVVIKNGQNLLSLTGATDYYPFGMPMPGRQIVNGQPYRYAFQGQEKDPETGKEAFQLRLWDGRIGRWLSPDPKGQFHSPYIGMGNNPISNVDPDGGCIKGYTEDKVPIPCDFKLDFDWDFEGNLWKKNIDGSLDMLTGSIQLHEVEVFVRRPDSKLTEGQVRDKIRFYEDFNRRRSESAKYFWEHPITQIMFAFATMGESTIAEGINAVALTERISLQQPKVYQYTLRAAEDGFFPIMERGSKNPVELGYLKKGEIWKVGTTKNLDTRYTQKFLDETKLVLEPEFSGTLQQSLELERMKIMNGIRINKELYFGNKIIK